MLHPIIKPPHQDLKILTQGDILFFNNIQNGLGKVVLVLHVIVEDGVVKGQLDWFQCVEMENNEIGAGLVGLLDVIDGDDLAVVKG